MGGNAAALLLSSLVIASGLGLTLLGLVISLIERKSDDIDGQFEEQGMRPGRETAGKLLKTGLGLILGGFVFAGLIKLIET